MNRWIRIHWTRDKDSLVHLLYHDPRRSDLGSLMLIRIIQKERTLWLSQISQSFCGCNFSRKSKSAFLWDYLHQDLWSKTTWNIETRHDPWHLLVCSLLSFIVFKEGWCVAWVASVSARVLYENGHSQESLVPLNLHPARDALCSCALCFKDVRDSGGDECPFVDRPHVVLKRICSLSFYQIVRANACEKWIIKAKF